MVLKISLKRSDPNRWISSWTTSPLNPLAASSRTLLLNSIRKETSVVQPHQVRLPGEKYGFTKARGNKWQWHHLRHMEICTSPQTDNHASIPPLNL